MNKSFALLFLLALGLVFLAGCPAKQSPSAPSGNPAPTATPSSTPSPTPTTTPLPLLIYANCAIWMPNSAMIAEMLYDGVTCFSCSGLPIAGPVTFNLTGPLSTPTPGGSDAPFQVYTSYTAFNDTSIEPNSGPIPVTLGQALTWVSTFTLDTADIDAACTYMNLGTLPADPLDYDFTAYTSEPVYWSYQMVSFYQYGPTGTKNYFGSTAILSTGDSTTFRQVEAPVTLVLDVPTSMM